jgi:hypothetical protein
MTCLSEQSYVLVALEQCKFHNVPGWARNVLVVWPHNPELVNVLLSYDCIVTIVVADMQEYQKLTTATEWAAWLQSRRIRVVHCNPDSYIAAVPLQHFVAVFLHSSAYLYTWQLQARRALTWNGGLYCFGDEQDIDTYEKQIGWMLMSYPRCGTHMLVSALNAHPDLTCHGEAFNPATAAGSHGFDTVQQVLEKSWPTPKTGFAVHASIDRMGHPLNMAESMRGVTDFWKIIPDYTPTILLTRRNLLARYVSHLSAMKTGVWNSTDQEKRNNVYASVYVDLNAFQRDMKYVQDCWDHAAAYFKYSFSVVYEDLLTDFDGNMRKIQEYLQVPYVQLLPETVKLAVSMEETIENYVQVRAWCRRTGHDRFLLEVLQGV